MIGEILKTEGNDNQPIVVCLHGFLGRGSDFKIVIDNFPGHPTLIAPDFPDYAKEPHRTDHPWATALETLNRFIDDQIGDRRCVLLGYSMGGRLALQYALKYDYLLKGLILIGTTPGISNEEERWRRLNQDTEMASRILNDPLETFLDSWAKQSLIQTQEQIAEPYRTNMRKLRLQHNREALAYFLIALGTGSMESAWHRLEELILPTLLITGEEDLKFTEIANKMSLLLPDSRFETIANAGHAACFEQPLKMARLLDLFLKELED